MDKLAKYRACVQQLLARYQGFTPPGGDVEAEVIVDSEHDHYQLVHVGWSNKRRVYGCTLHFDIIHGKVWLQHNGTDCHVAAELVELGVPKENIVLGFQAPHRRQFTEYAVG